MARAHGTHPEHPIVAEISNTQCRDGQATPTTRRRHLLTRTQRNVIVNIGTWNMQGSSHSTEQKWNTGLGGLFAAKEPWAPDVMCLQETGGAPASAVPGATINVPVPGAPPGTVAPIRQYTWGGTRTRPAYNILFHNWDVAGNRCNLAIVAKASLALANPTLCWPAAGPVWRPALGVQVGAQYVFSLHAISGSGADAKGLLTAAATAAGATNWLAAGDFNTEPNAASLPAGAQLWPPEAPTFSTSAPTKKYDYAVATAGLGAAQTGSRASVVLSDHIPVCYP
jgi:cytolethal distending toxin subunit B